MAAAGVVYETSGIVLRMAIVDGIVEAAQRDRRALFVTLGSVVQDDVKEDADASLRIGGAELAQVINPARSEPWIEREEVDGIVAPAIAQPHWRQMALVHPCRDRHELDMADAETAQMIDDARFAQRGERSAQRLRYRGWRMLNAFAAIS